MASKIVNGGVEGVSGTGTAAASGSPNETKKTEPVSVNGTNGFGFYPRRSPNNGSRPGSGLKTPENKILKKTIIRFKRRIEDSPSKILVVSFKRSKTEGVVGDEGEAVASSSKEPEEVRSQILRLVGTVAEVEADNNHKIVDTVRNVLATASPSIENSLRKNIKARSRKKIGKTREEFRQNAEENRFKIINRKRGIENGVDSESPDSKEGAGDDLLKLLDLVPEHSLKKAREPPEGYKPGSILCNGVPMVKGKAQTDSESDDGYVYDLYFASDPLVEEHFNGHLVSVEEGEDPDFCEYRGEGFASDNELQADDDEDSNAEDNWRNDYPDDSGVFRFSCDDDSFGGDGIADLSLGGAVGGRDDDSSDEDLIYGIDDDDNNHSFSFDKKYQKFKLRFRDQYSNEVVSSESEDEDEEAEEGMNCL